jgi:hypothetical protein
MYEAKRHLKVLLVVSNNVRNPDFLPVHVNGTREPCEVNGYLRLGKGLGNLMPNKQKQHHG